MYRCLNLLASLCLFTSDTKSQVPFKHRYTSKEIPQSSRVEAVSSLSPGPAKVLNAMLASYGIMLTGLNINNSMYDRLGENPSKAGLWQPQHHHKLPSQSWFLWNTKPLWTLASTGLSGCNGRWQDCVSRRPTHRRRECTTTSKVAGTSLPTGETREASLHHTVGAGGRIRKERPST